MYKTQYRVIWKYKYFIGHFDGLVQDCIPPGDTVVLH